MPRSIMRSHTSAASPSDYRRALLRMVEQVVLPKRCIRHAQRILDCSRLPAGEGTRSWRSVCVLERLHSMTSPPHIAPQSAPCTVPSKATPMTASSRLFSAIKPADGVVVLHLAQRRAVFVRGCGPFAGEVFGVQVAGDAFRLRLGKPFIVVFRLKPALYVGAFSRSPMCWLTKASSPRLGKEERILLSGPAGENHGLCAVLLRPRVSAHPRAWAHIRGLGAPSARPRRRCPL